MASQERRQFLAKVATMYYLEHRTQAQIARELGYSRSGVSRLLDEAHRQGIIEIKIHSPLQRLAEIEAQLLEHFSLTAALVLSNENYSYSHLKMKLGELGAAYLVENLPKGSRLGIGSGATISELVNVMSPQHREDTEVIQITGAIGTVDPVIDGPVVVQNFAQKLGTNYHALHGPHFVGDIETKKALLREKNIRETIELGSLCDMYLIGIGTTDPARSTLLEAGFVSDTELKSILQHGAVGDICGYHFDQTGNILDLEINQRVIGIEVAAIMRPNCSVIAICGESKKGPAILAALRGNYIDVLITDSSAATWMLDQVNGHSEGP